MSHWFKKLSHRSFLAESLTAMEQNFCLCFICQLYLRKRRKKLLLVNEALQLMWAFLIVHHFYTLVQLKCTVYTAETWCRMSPCWNSTLVADYKSDERFLCVRLFCGNWNSYSWPSYFRVVWIFNHMFYFFCIHEFSSYLVLPRIFHWA